MKPVPTPEVIFGKKSRKRARVESIGHTVVESLQLGTKVSRDIDYKKFDGIVRQTERSTLGFVNKQKTALQAAPHGLEMAAHGAGFTVNAHAEALPKDSKDDTRWTLRVLNDQTGNVSLFAVTTRERETYGPGQNRMHIDVIDPETGESHYSFFNQHDRAGLYESVDKAFTVLAAAQSLDTLHVEELPSPTTWVKVPGGRPAPPEFRD